MECAKREVILFITVMLMWELARVKLNITPATPSSPLLPVERDFTPLEAWKLAKDTFGDDAVTGMTGTTCWLNVTNSGHGPEYRGKSWREIFARATADQMEGK